MFCPCMTSSGRDKQTGKQSPCKKCFHFKHLKKEKNKKKQKGFLLSRWFWRGEKPPCFWVASACGQGPCMAVASLRALVCDSPVVLPSLSWFGLLGKGVYLTNRTPVCWCCEHSALSGVFAVCPCSRSCEHWNLAWKGKLLEAFIRCVPQRAWSAYVCVSYCSGVIQVLCSVPRLVYFNL